MLLQTMLNTILFGRPHLKIRAHWSLGTDVATMQRRPTLFVYCTVYIARGVYTIVSLVAWSNQQLLQLKNRGGGRVNLIN